LRRKDKNKYLLILTNKWNLVELKIIFISIKICKLSLNNDALFVSENVLFIHMKDTI